MTEMEKMLRERIEFLERRLGEISSFAPQIASSNISSEASMTEHATSSTNLEHLDA